MKRFICCAIVFCLVSPLTAFADGLDVFLSNVNVQARVSLPDFSAKISAQFGVPLVQVQAVIGSVREPADAFMVFQLGQMSGRSPDQVMAVYRPNQGKGWGAVAQELGIKPGSDDFHALKNGNLSFTGKSSGHKGESAKGASGNKGKEKDKGKGHK